MANEMYPLSRQAFGDGDLDFVGQDWRAALLDDTYTYDPNHEFYDDLVGVLADSGNLTGKSNVLGVMDADDVTFTSVTAGDDVERIVVYQWTGVAATSRVVIFYDTLASAAMINTPTDGGDIIVRWSNGSTKMFRI